jgi:hypothetical protein
VVVDAERGLQLLDTELLQVNPEARLWFQSITLAESEDL